MVRSEVYLNKYVVSIAPFSTPACPDCSLFVCFRFLIFYPFFQGGSADPICPYVWTPMEPCRWNRCVLRFPVSYLHTLSLVVHALKKVGFQDFFLGLGV